MKNKIAWFVLPLFIIVSIVANSCKKNDTGLIKTLFTGGTWQLASVMVFNYVGSSLMSTDTLNTDCEKTQFFTFYSNNTCNYKNFHCFDQSTNGSWSLTHDELFLMVTMSVKDTIAGGAISQGNPFGYTKIKNLGQYSMVLQTGDISAYATPGKKRQIIEYGFVRQKSESGK